MASGGDAPPPAASSAGADVSKRDVGERPTTARGSRWYGWQTFTSDALSIAFLVAAANTSRGTQTALGEFGGIAYVVGAPAVHLGHARPGPALLSLALRISLPLLGLYVGLQSASQDELVPAGAVVGFLGGAFTAVVIDGVALSWESAEPASVARSRFVLAPFVHPEHGGATWGVGGAF
jgi:hypothetical protein